MERECREIVESVCGRSSNTGRTVTGVRRKGRVWSCCVSCAGLIVLVGQGWYARKQGEEPKEKNGYILMVCGRCERKNGQLQEGGVRICAEMVAGSPAYEGVAEHCRSLGWEEVEVKSERVMDRKALFGGLSGWHGESMMVKSVKVYRQSSEKGVEVLDYVEGGLL